MNKLRQVDVGDVTALLFKEMSQWFLNITKYAQELLDGLETINFPENVKALQKDWIGRSEGAEIDFKIEEWMTQFEYYN